LARMAEWYSENKTKETANLYNEQIH
jgi:hypothetical protein